MSMLFPTPQKRILNRSLMKPVNILVIGAVLAMQACAPLTKTQV